MTVLAFILGVAFLVVGLAVSIALHEIGHLVPAKLFRVRVGQYMIGFGKTLFSWKFRGTEYGVKALPVGGYISMAGMYPPSGKTGRAGGGLFATMVQDARDANDETLEDRGDRRAFYELPVYQRVIVMLGGPLMNLVFAIVLFTIMVSGIGVQQPTTTIAAVDKCVVAADAGRTECEPSDPVAPAAAAGLLPGDVLVSVAGTPVSNFTEAATIIQASPGQSVPVVISRDGAEQTLTMTPIPYERELTDAEGNVETREVGFVGMTAVLGLVREPITAGPQAAWEQTQRVVEIMVQLPVRIYNTAADLVTGQDRDPNGPISVVGAGRIAGEIAAVDAPVLSRLGALVGLLAGLNIALFIFNLIPLLPLDGGHIAVALWDGIKRVAARLTGRPAPKPVDATKLVPVTFVVVILLIVMGAVLILADVFNPVDLFR